METARPSFSKYLFVCENEKPDAACCGMAGTKIREALKLRVKELKLNDKIRVSRAGCIDACAEGPNVLLMPDEVWFKHVTAADLDEIIQMAGKNFK